MTDDKIGLEIAKEWILALRSNEYKKINGKLKDNCGFCALGVLADICVKKGIGEWVEMIGDYGPIQCFQYQRGKHYTDLGPSLTYRLSPFFDTGEGGFSSSVALMNDNGCPFNSIALVLEGRLRVNGYV